MPLRWTPTDPFLDPTGPKRAYVNPFIDALRNGFADGSLPVLYGPSVTAQKGRWLAETPPPGRLLVEIGCHKGVVLTQLAKNHPHDLVVGADITFKRVVMTAEAAVEQGLKNVKSIMANARAIRDVFADGEVDGLLIFFPDPWPKKRHAKNRLLSEEFCKNAMAVLKPGGFLWLKTDQQSYFEMACENMQLAGFVATGHDPVQDQPYVSCFEQRFAAQGLASFAQLWHKPQPLC